MKVPFDAYLVSWNNHCHLDRVTVVHCEGNKVTVQDQDGYGVVNSSEIVALSPGNENLKALMAQQRKYAEMLERHYFNLLERVKFDAEAVDARNT
jgi:hypothetical protein